MWAPTGENDQPWTLINSSYRPRKEKAGEMLNTHEVPPLPEDVDHKISRILRLQRRRNVRSKLLEGRSTRGKPRQEIFVNGVMSMDEESQEKQQLFEERVARYQATIALEPTDRMIVGGTGSNNFAEVYSGYTIQDIVYDMNKWTDSECKFVEAFPQIDMLRSGRIWAPLIDTVGYKLCRIPGRDLPPKVIHQFVEGEWMKADEYDILINDPVTFLMDYRLPRVLSEFGERGSTRSYIAFLKSGIAYAMIAQQLKEKALLLERKYGIPRPHQGAVLAPFDLLADGYRGLQGIMIDIFERPEKILEACEALIPEMVSAAIDSADPQKRYPIFLPLHRGCHPFLSPQQFDTFYWPSLKKMVVILIEAGYTIRAYLEGDWTPNWHHWNELPRGKVICDIDDRPDISRAKKEIGDTVCLAGGIPSRMFIFGTPDDIRARVKELCETVGKDGGFIINGGCSIPHDTKPENFRAYIDATLEYGKYSDRINHKLKPTPPSPANAPTSEHLSRVITPWEVKLKELGGVVGDETLIKDSWENLERMAYRWLHLWDH